MAKDREGRVAARRGGTHTSLARERPKQGDLREVETWSTVPVPGQPGPHRETLSRGGGGEREQRTRHVFTGLGSTPGVARLLQALPIPRGTLYPCPSGCDWLRALFSVTTTGRPKVKHPQALPVCTHLAGPRRAGQRPPLTHSTLHS